jgi:hypothetical protein
MVLFHLYWKYNSVIYVIFQKTLTFSTTENIENEFSLWYNKGTIYCVRWVSNGKYYDLWRCWRSKSIPSNC